MKCQNNVRCTITGGLWAADLATIIQLSTNTNLFYTEGGIFQDDGNPNNYNLKNASISTGYTTVYNALEFYTSANKVRIVCFVGGGSTQYAAFRVNIDGQYFTHKPTVILTLTGQVPGTVNFIDLDFSSFGSTGTTRRVRFEYDNVLTMQKISYDTGSFWSVGDNNKPKVCFYGDSFFGSGAGPTAATPTYPMENIAVRTARALEWEPTVSGVGATGYTATGGNYTFSDTRRTVDFSLKKFDAFVIAGGTNDDVNQLSLITANCLTVLIEARKANAGATIFLVGVWNDQLSSARKIEGAIYAAYLQFNDNNTYFIPCCADPLGPWITAANKGQYIDVDTVHPTARVGETYFSNRLIKKIRDAINI